MVNTNTRLTWQATPRNKVSLFVDIAPFVVWHRQYTFPLAPEATAYAPYYPNAFKTISWKSTITNGCFSIPPRRTGCGPEPAAADARNMLFQPA
jgi:hypothetical protein